MIKFNLLNSIIGGQYRLIVMPEIPHYKRIAPILDKRPDNLEDIITNLKAISGITDPEWFSYEKGADINALLDGAAKKYTPIVDDPYPIKMPDISIEDKHYSRFYKAMVDLECLRIRHQLLDYSHDVKDDYQTRKEVKSTLSELSRKTNEAAWEAILIGDEMFPRKDVPLDIRMNSAKEPMAIYDYLTFSLVNLYYELVLLFKPILKESDYIQPFEFEFDRGIDGFLPYDLPGEFNLTELIHKAQRCIVDDKPGDASKVLAELKDHAEEVESRPALLKVAAALENFIFISSSGTHVTDVKQLIEKTVVSPVVKAQREAFRAEYEKEDTALERSNVIEELLSDYDLNNCFKCEQSIKYHLATFLNKQNELYLQDPAAVYVTRRKSGQKPGSPKPLPVSTAMPVKDKIACVHKRIAFLDGIDPDTQDRVMPKTDFELLKTYLEDLVKSNQCPVITHRVPRIPKGVTWVRYTVYLIHQDIFHDNIQDEWIDFLYRGLVNDKDPEWDVLKKRFSIPPSGYNQYVKRITGE